jgi:hypothetical protein
MPDETWQFFLLVDLLAQSYEIADFLFLTQRSGWILQNTLLHIEPFAIPFPTLTTYSHF